MTVTATRTRSTSNAAAVQAYRHGRLFATTLDPADTDTVDARAAALRTTHPSGVGRWFLDGLRDALTEWPAVA
jgi:hypothetical protein